MAIGANFDAGFLGNPPRTSEEQFCIFCSKKYRAGSTVQSLFG